MHSRVTQVSAQMAAAKDCIRRLHVNKTNLKIQIHISASQRVSEKERVTRFARYAVGRSVGVAVSRA